MMCDTTYPMISDDQALTDDCLSPSFSVWEDLSFSRFSDYEDLGNTLPDIHLDDDFLSFDLKEETVFDSQPSSPLPSSPQVKVESSCSSPAPVVPPQAQSVENKLFVEYQKTIEEQNAQLELHRQLMHQYREQVQQLQFQQQLQQQHYQCLMQNQQQQMQQMQLQVTANSPSNFYPSPVQSFTGNTGSVVVSTPPATPPSPISPSHWNYPIVRPSAMISATPLSSPSMSPSYSSPSYTSPSPSPTVDSANGMEMTNLNTAYFGSVPQSRFGKIPMDISGNLTDSDYKKIFRKYHKVLLLDSHPQMTEQDLEDIQENGRMYFLRNVKTIVPKIGPWKFHAHISRRRSDERQYNIPGRPITCKVKEWLTDDGLWRLYHYKKGKNPKK